MLDYETAKLVDLFDSSLPWEGEPGDRVLHYVVPDGTAVTTTIYHGDGRLTTVGEPGDTIHAYDEPSGINVIVR